MGTSRFTEIFVKHEIIIKTTVVQFDDCLVEFTVENDKPTSAFLKWGKWKQTECQSDFIVDDKRKGFVFNFSDESNKVISALNILKDKLSIK